MWAATRARWVLNNPFRESRDTQEGEKKQREGGREQRRKGGRKAGREGEREKGRKGTKMWEGRSDWARKWMSNSGRERYMIQGEGY